MQHTYLLFQDILFLNELNTVEHGLVVNRRKSRDDLQKEMMLRISSGIIAGQYFEDVAIEIESIFKVSDLVLELVVLLTQHLLHLIYNIDLTHPNPITLNSTYTDHPNRTHKGKLYSRTSSK